MTAEIAELASSGGRVAIDTEFVSERRYQAQLCLIQVAAPDGTSDDGVRTDVLDPLGERPFDPAPLVRVLADPGVEVLMHAGRQDVAILRRTWSTEITNIFDTQVAAGFLGMGGQEGYESLVRRVLGEQLGGGEGFTRWDKRPLTPKQIEYAADDARCLLALAERMGEELAKRGRLDWAREESRLLERSSDARTRGRALERLPKANRLDTAGRAAAWRLCGWREEVAQSVDRPPSFVIGDQQLVELARRRPTDRAGLEQIRGLASQTMHRRGGELLGVIASEGGDAPPPAPPSGPRRDPSEAPLVSLAQAIVRHRAQESGVATELIATQSEIAALVASVRRGSDGSDVRALSGWRRELVGQELSELVSGRRSVSVGEDGALVVAELSDKSPRR